MSVIIRPDHSPGEITRVAKALLAAADNPADVKMETFGDGPFFVVPDEIAQKAVLNPEEPKETKAASKASKKRKDQN